ncbi:MAG: DUF1667 domain-containing protein [Spirochaetaceae bacterium]
MSNTNKGHTADAQTKGDIREMVCIVCPIGCRLKVEVTPDSGGAIGSGSTFASEGRTGSDEPEVTVSGNKCPRGEAYAREEVLAPKRTVTATCRITGSPHVRRVPVKTDAALPVEHIDSLLSKLYSLKLEAPISIGAIVFEDIEGTGINVLTTRSVAAEE